MDPRGPTLCLGTKNCSPRFNAGQTKIIGDQTLQSWVQLLSNFSPVWDQRFKSNADPVSFFVFVFLSYLGTKYFNFWHNFDMILPVW